MERPRIEDFTKEEHYNPDEVWYNYLQAVEKYCDRLEEALDRACGDLTEYHIVLYNLVSELNSCSANPRTEPYPKPRTKEEWKTEILKDKE